MKYLIVGLGNIGAEYRETRHNVGFKVVDHMALNAGGTWVTERYGSVCEISVKGKKLVLLKPSTYMNLSGNAVRYWMQNQKIEQDNILVVVDDVALDFGVLRMRKGGSDGGHNGLKHINEVLGGGGYARLRVGIGGDFPRGFMVDYVLGEWTQSEKDEMDDLCERSAKAVGMFARSGIAMAMNTVNKKADVPKKEKTDGSEN